ncbi:MAG: phosphorylcholine transferase LicD [Akkermansia sp.]
MNIVRDIRSIQILQLSTLRFFHHLCTEHQLRYFLVGGTLLGAIRHRGFIPWDDDIDLGMPRRDYECFLSIMQQGRYPYRVYHLAAEQDCCIPFCKMYDTRTILLKERDRISPAAPGLSVDIFPYDGYGSQYHQAALSFYLANRLMKAIALAGSTPPPHTPVFKRCLIHALGIFATHKRLLHRHLCHHLKKTDFDQSGYVAGTDGMYGIREVQPAEGFTQSVELNFEGISVPAPAGWDHYLHSLYGDYMQLPPPEKRTPSHELCVGLRDDADFPELSQC